ncbi:Polygalacturonase [Venturia nashicola]|nr:Polygalacturonase [Venturia nashicola]
MIKRAMSSSARKPSKLRSPCVASLRQPSVQQKRYSSQTKETNKETKDEIDEKKISHFEPKVKPKTQAELDRELELKMAGLAGDGGEAGLELEDGKAVSMKRSVRENMFRYI